MNKRYLKVVFLAAIIVVLTILNYNNTYYITDNMRDIKEGIISFSNSRAEGFKALKVIETKKLESYWLVLFVSDNRIGIATLKQGVNGKCKVVSYNCGGAYIKSRVKEIDNKKYFTVRGYNTGEVKKVIAIFNKEKYEIEVDIEEGYFLEVIPVEDKEIRIFPDKIMLINSQGQDIFLEYLEKMQNGYRLPIN